MFFSLLLLFGFSVVVSGSPLAKRTLTGPFDCQSAGQYTLCQNLWGAKSGVGSQNSTLISASGNTVSWSTVYTWANAPNNVKSCECQKQIKLLMSYMNYRRKCREYNCERGPGEFAVLCPIMMT